MPLNGNLTEYSVNGILETESLSRGADSVEAAISMERRASFGAQ